MNKHRKPLHHNRQPLAKLCSVAFKPICGPNASVWKIADGVGALLIYSFSLGWLITSFILYFVTVLFLNIASIANAVHRQVTMIIMNSGSQLSESLSVSQMSQVSRIVTGTKEFAKKK